MLVRYIAALWHHVQTKMATISPPKTANQSAVSLIADPPPVNTEAASTCISLLRKAAGAAAFLGGPVHQRLQQHTDGAATAKCASSWCARVCILTDCSAPAAAAGHRRCGYSTSRGFRACCWACNVLNLGRCATAHKRRKCHRSCAFHAPCLRRDAWLCISSWRGTRMAQPRHSACLPLCCSLALLKVAEVVCVFCVLVPWWSQAHTAAPAAHAMS